MQRIISAHTRPAFTTRGGEFLSLCKIPPCLPSRLADTLALLPQIAVNGKDVIMTKSELTLEKIRCLIGKGGSGSEWFAHAYVSWYRSFSENRLISLAGVERLDSNNILLFWEMINLRRRGNYDDEALYELEIYATKEWRMNEPTTR